MWDYSLGFFYTAIHSFLLLTCRVLVEGQALVVVLVVLVGAQLARIFLECDVPTILNGFDIKSFLAD